MGKSYLMEKKPEYFPGGGEIGYNSYIQAENDASIELGENIHIDNYCELFFGPNSQTKIGADTWFNAYMVIYNHSAGKCVIGQGCRFGRFNLLAVCSGDNIEIGEYSLTARNVSIMSNDGHPIFDILSGKQINFRERYFLKIGSHVWMGNGVIVMSECDIGKNSMVGAGSFIRNRRFSNNCMIVGNPAHVIRENITWNSTSVNGIGDIDPQYVELTAD